MLMKFILVLLSGIMIGYNLGYREGKKKGKMLGQYEAPLIILEKSLKNGYCILCNRKTYKLD